MRRPDLIFQNQNGQGLTEYVILLLLVTVVSIGAVRALGNTVNRKFKEVRQQVNSAKTGNADSGGDSGGGGILNSVLGGGDG